jgi:hypothetical protein
MYKKRKRSIKNKLQKKYLAKELKITCAIILQEPPKITKKKYEWFVYYASYTRSSND